MHEINGKRMNRYHELGQYAFGKFRTLPPYHVYTTAALTWLTNAHVHRSESWSLGSHSISVDRHGGLR